MENKQYQKKENYFTKADLLTPEHAQNGGQQSLLNLSISHAKWIEIFPPHTKERMPMFWSSQTS